MLSLNCIISYNIKFYSISFLLNFRALYNFVVLVDYFFDQIKRILIILMYITFLKPYSSKILYSFVLV